MKKIIALVCVVLVFTLLFAPTVAFAGLGGYATKEFRVKATVTDDNAYHIEEHILVNFTESRHGIYRYIPIRQTIRQNTSDGEKRMQYHIEITDLKVLDDPFSTYVEGDNYVIQLGDPDQTITGEKEYVISYTLHIGADRLSEYDFFYLTAIPNEWETSIDHAEVSITLPHAFDANAVEVFRGQIGQTTAQDVDIQIAGQTITVATTEPLAYGEGITVYTRLEEGYFTSVPKSLDPAVINITLIAFAIFITILVWLLFNRFGRDKKPVVTVEFYPPEDMDSAEAACILTHRADTQSVISLIIYWASQGYLEIIEKEKKKITLVKKNFLPMDAPNYQRTLFEGIFAYGEQVSLSTLQNKVYEDVGIARKQLLTGTNSKIYNKKSMVAQKLAGFLAVLPILAAGIRVLMDAYVDFTISILCITLLGALYIGTLAVYTSAVNKWTIRSKVTNVIQLLFAVALFILMWGVVLLIAMGTAGYSFLYYIALLLIHFIAMLFIPHINQWNAYGYEMTGKLRGFRAFIEKAEKKRIEVLVEQDPAYFYNILPYAYALGVSDKWAKQFESIAVEPPSWYTGYQPYTMFNTILFVSMMHHTMNSVNSTFISVPAKSYSGGGGSFSGGGFSGGGFGGGGGGSW